MIRSSTTSRSRSRSLLVVGTAFLVAAALTACSSSSPKAARPSGKSSGKVLLVGTFRGRAGEYKSIQSAVDAAAPGDWILVAPGDYHESADLTYPPKSFEHGDFGGVYITKSNLHLRGMSRADVVVDGTKPGSSRCSSDPKDQQFGAKDQDGKTAGRNGILVWKANGVSVENLTACNFLGGADESGNEVWWNGGAESGTIGLHGYTGRYLTATSTYFGGEATAAQYGIFSSDAQGPGLWDQLYASNFNDSGMYVGACLQVCDVTINHAWMQYSVLGYSGTNSGGAIIIENSEFDHNQDGFDTNTQIAGDPPAPQDGACPDNGTSPITHTHSCWVFMHNNVHDNNNPNAPKAGNASNGPLGTGMTVSGGRNDTIMDNTFTNNGAWGILFAPFPDSGKPDLKQTCSGTGGTRDLRARLCLRGLRKRAGSQHVQPQRILRKPLELRLRADRPDTRETSQLLPVQHRSGRQLTRRPGPHPTHLRRDAVQGDRCRRPAEPGPVRHRLRQVPGGCPLPEDNRRRDAPAAHQPAHHGEPVRGGAS